MTYDVGQGVYWEFITNKLSLKSISQHSRDNARLYCQAFILRLPSIARLNTKIQVGKIPGHDKFGHPTITVSTLNDKDTFNAFKCLAYR